MYALKARDKLHKQEKKAYEERHSPNPRSKRNDKHKKQPQGRPGPVTVNREAKVSSHSDYNDMACSVGCLNKLLQLMYQSSLHTH